ALSITQREVTGVLRFVKHSETVATGNREPPHPQDLKGFGEALIVARRRATTSSPGQLAT
ncbi:MAG: hypothetical protein M3325_06470, partial [Actinomycetota bacterium]|nr:hypothetical protein [Actinomycetota bacterium]